MPRWEIVSLADYRQRHSTYVLDEGLSNLRRRAPVMTTWDDHGTWFRCGKYREWENVNALNLTHQHFSPPMLLFIVCNDHYRDHKCKFGFVDDAS